MFHLRLLKRKRLQLLAARCGIPTPVWDFKSDRSPRCRPTNRGFVALNSGEGASRLIAVELWSIVRPRFPATVAELTRNRIIFGCNFLTRRAALCVGDEHVLTLPETAKLPRGNFERCWRVKKAHFKY